LALQFIDKPTGSMIYEALQQNGWAIKLLIEKHIEITDYMWQIAIRQNKLVAKLRE
jgi:hypothetical protein